MDREPIIRLENVHKAFGTTQVLRGATLAVDEGTTAVVMGGSGSGKSVLIKHIVQLLRPDEGRVWVDGQRVDELRGDELDRLRLRIGYLFQGGALFDSMSVFENIAFLLDRHADLTDGEQQDRIEQLLDWVGLTETMSRRPAELSGGQKKRIALARALALDPHIMLFDEPTTGLDPVSVRTVSELIVRLREEREMTSVAITHDLLCAEIVSDRAHFLYEGQIVAEGTLSDLETSDHPAVGNFFGKGR